MQIFLDSSNPDEIRKWHSAGIVAGITTNPTIMMKEGAKSIRDAYDKITRIVGDVPISLEVTSDEPGVILEQAIGMKEWGANVVIKVPIVARDGKPMLESIRTLSQKGVTINCTAMLSMGQLMLAHLAGAKYLSLFCGRVSDEGGDSFALVQKCRRWLDVWRMDGLIIAGSMRGVPDIQQAAEAGAHILTIPPALLLKLVDHRYSRDTVRQFLDDARGVPMDGAGGARAGSAGGAGSDQGGRPGPRRT